MREMKDFHSMKVKLMWEERQPNNESIKQNASKHISLTFRMKDVKNENYSFTFTNE